MIVQDGRQFESNFTIWATEAEALNLTAESDLDTMHGFFKVNNFLQSTSHPNVFAGGDCITMEHFPEKGYLQKAGTHAIKQGPILAENVKDFIMNKPL